MACTYFPLFGFKIFFLSLVFSVLTMISLSMLFDSTWLFYVLHGICRDSWFSDLIPFDSIFKAHYFFKYFFCPIFFFFLMELSTLALLYFGSFILFCIFLFYEFLLQTPTQEAPIPSPISPLLIRPSASSGLILPPLHPMPLPPGLCPPFFLLSLCLGCAGLSGRSQPAGCTRLPRPSCLLHLVLLALWLAEAAVSMVIPSKA